MPLVKPQELKSLNTIALQPEKMSPRIEAIICMDLAGKGTNDIARELGLTAARISIIKTSPMYVQQRAREQERLKEMYRDKQSDRLVSGDPVENVLKDAALQAARCKIDLMQNGKSEFVKLAASGDILDRAGYKAAQEKTKVSIEITDKMASRFEAALAFGSRVVVGGGEALSFGKNKEYSDAERGKGWEEKTTEHNQKEQPESSAYADLGSVKVKVELESGN